MQKITIKDVAKACGVSTQTISRVINNSNDVKDSTRKLVLAKIKELGYRPNLYAKNLSNKKNKNILISIRRIKGYVATIWTTTLINEIIVCNTNPDVSILVEQFYDESELDNSLLNTYNTFIDGVIIFYESENDKRIKMLKNSEIPYVIVGKSYNENDIYIGVDDYNTTFKGIEYLFEKNITRINFITANPTPLNNERKKGVIDAYKKNKINKKKLVINEGMNKQEEIYELVQNICKKNKLPEAFFVSGDEKAIVVLKALYDCGIKIPEQVSVLGIDNIAISQYLQPSLTTMALDYNKIVNRVYTKIINMINGKIEKSEEIECQIIERESVKK